MLDAQVNALLDVTVLDLLVDDNSDGALGNVVHNTGLSVVNLVRHTICELEIILAFQAPPAKSVAPNSNATHPF